jgi:hypothetical protein
MDEKELVTIGMEVALKPITDIASDALGVAGGAWLHEQHIRVRRRLKARTAELFNERKVDAPIEPSPSIIIPLLSHAQEETRDELLDLWARLLAAAMDPKRSFDYRRDYVDIVRRLEPKDTSILALLTDYNSQAIRTRPELSTQLDLRLEQIEIASRNLLALGLVTVPAGTFTVESGLLYRTALGSELIRLLR